MAFDKSAQDFVAAASFAVGEVDFGVSFDLKQSGHSFRKIGGLDGSVENAKRSDAWVVHRVAGFLFGISPGVSSSFIFFFYTRGKDYGHPRTSVFFIFFFFSERPAE